jgi:hypothetical protein
MKIRFENQICISRILKKFGNAYAKIKNQFLIFRKSLCKIAGNPWKSILKIYKSKCMFFFPRAPPIPLLPLYLPYTNFVWIQVRNLNSYILYFILIKNRNNTYLKFIIGIPFSSLHGPYHAD